MKRSLKICLGLLVVCIAIVLAQPAHAVKYNLLGKEVSVEGYFRQEFAFNVSETSDEKTNQPGLHSAYQVWYLDTNTRLTSNLEMRAIFRLFGDMVYAIRGDSNHFERYFKSSKDNLQWDDDFRYLLREFYLSYSARSFFIRVGKQQIGWGEADGLRLMDVINPLDGRRGPFYDTEGYEEVRIPKWLVKTVLYPGNFKMFYDLALELIWNPGDVQEYGELLPPYANAQLAGPTGFFGPGVPVGCQHQWGVWGIPVNFVPLPVRLNKKEHATALKNSEFGARLSFNFCATNMTLNYWQGFQTDSVLKFAGIMPDPVGGSIFPPLGVMTPSTLVMNREYRRMRVVGFTLSRELYGFGPLVGQAANPVLRVEALFEFKKPFNTALNTATDFIHIRDYDQIRYMVGFDWPVRMRFINPSKNVFLSGQVFHIHTLNYRNGVDAPRPAPFYTWTYPQNQFYSSLLVRTEYFNEKVVPSALLVWDHNNQSAWGKFRVGFKHGDHWRPEIGYVWIKRNTHHSQFMGLTTITDNWKAFGTFEDRDEVYVRIQYQF